MTVSNEIVDTVMSTPISTKPVETTEKPRQKLERLEREAIQIGMEPRELIRRKVDAEIEALETWIAQWRARNPSS
jgi:hypothetical protein